MVFSSIAFLFAFLPLAVAGYHVLNRYKWGRASLLFLFLMSLFYYGYWKWNYTLIIVASIAVNYLLGQTLMGMTRHRKPFFIFGLALNLGALSYFKYTDFIIASINSVAGTDIPLQHILLPIGISFYTFQQIAYLADIYTRKYEPDKGFLNYCLFVCFFPQEVAGPIVHHHEMMPQFASPRNRRFDWDNMYKGFVLVGLGLGKKVLVADMLIPLVSATFNNMETLTLTEAWMGGTAYMLQAYFDFAGYSDMAIGCGLLFNIHLPINFDSPLKSRNPGEFWRRWHITLSRWLRDYLYIPMGGSRKGFARTISNTFITFLLGGLWHGAAWTYVTWGALHGAALGIMRIWGRYVGYTFPKLLAILMTFLFTMVAAIFLRSPSFGHAFDFLQGMVGMNGLGPTEMFKGLLNVNMAFVHFSFITFRTLLPVFLVITFFAPNSLQILGDGKPTLWRTGLALASALASILVISSPSRVTEFLYFQF